MLNRLHTIGYFMGTFSLIGFLPVGTFYVINLLSIVFGLILFLSTNWWAFKMAHAGKDSQLSSLQNKYPAFFRWWFILMCANLFAVFIPLLKLSRAFTIAFSIIIAIVSFYALRKYYVDKLLQYVLSCCRSKAQHQFDRMKELQAEKDQHLLAEYIVLTYSTYARPWLMGEGARLIFSFKPIRLESLYTQEEIDFLLDNNQVANN